MKNDRVDGYVKPFFKNVDVYDRRQDEDKSVFKKMYEGLVEGVNELLSREPQDRTAARTEFTGKVDDPQADTWQTVVTLIQNAFFKAILPRLRSCHLRIKMVERICLKVKSPSAMTVF